MEKPQGNFIYRNLANATSILGVLPLGLLFFLQPAPAVVWSLTGAAPHTSFSLWPNFCFLVLRYEMLCSLGGISIGSCSVIRMP